MVQEISPDSARKCIQAYYDAKKNIEKINIPNTMNEYIAYKIDCMEDGLLKTNGRVYKPDSIKPWKSFAKL